MKTTHMGISSFLKVFFVHATLWFNSPTSAFSIAVTSCSEPPVGAPLMVLSSLPGSPVPMSPVLPPTVMRTSKKFTLPSSTFDGDGVYIFINGTHRYNTHSLHCP